MKYQQTDVTTQAATQETTQVAPTQKPVVGSAVANNETRRGPYDTFVRPHRKTRSYNPTPIRRRVRRAETTPEIACGVTKSFTRADEGIEHRPEVDLVTGECRCNCEHSFYRLNPTAKKLGITISIKTPLLHCKHLERFIEGCVRRGELRRDAEKVLHLTHAQASPVEKIAVPPHIDPETGELKPGYLPNGDWDYNSYFD